MKYYFCTTLRLTFMCIDGLAPAKFCRLDYRSSMQQSYFDLCNRELLDDLAFIREIPASQHGGLHDLTRAPKDTSSPTHAVSSASADSSTNVWAANFIPQYGGRQDFPSIPMQIPLSSGTFDYGTSGPELDATTAMEGQLLWQMPSGFEYGFYLSCRASSLLILSLA